MIVLRPPGTEGHSTRVAEAGFTLLEVLVALAILALSLSTILYTISTAVGRSAQSEATTQARLLAQSLLARVGREIPAKAGELEGDDGRGHHWQLRQIPYGASDDRARQQVSIVEVSAEVRWGTAPSARSLTITTLRLAPGSELR